MSGEYKLKWNLIQCVCMVGGRGLRSREGNEGGITWVNSPFSCNLWYRTSKNKPILKPEYARLNFEKMVICYVKYVCVCVHLYVHMYVENGTKNIILES